MKRRDFITLVGGATAAMSTAAYGQLSLPIVGVLNGRGAGEAPELLMAFRQGLRDSGFVEGQSVAIEYRYAEHQNERLPALASELVRRQVMVLAATNTAAAVAAKAATASIPIVFAIAANPVQLGLVVSLNRPGGNVTGVTQLALDVTAKRLELLHQLLPTATTMALLVNPSNPVLAEPQIKDLQAAAPTLGLELHVVNASSEREFDGAFTKLKQLRAAALVIGEDTVFTSHSEDLAGLAARHAMPAIYDSREFVAAGGLISYGGSHTDAYYLVGVYTARILKGEKPSDLPVQQRTKVQLLLNLKTAKALGITVPLPLLGGADEVIE
jgi:putative ABC transport system substrate-binding protein